MPVVARIKSTNGKLNWKNKSTIHKNVRMKTKRIIILLTLTLLALNLTAQTEEVFYSPKLLHTDLSGAKLNLERVLKIMSFSGNKNNYWGKPENVSVLDDRFEITFKKPIKPVVFYFNNLKQYNLVVYRIHRADNSWDFEIRLGDLIIKASKSSDYGWEIADYLFTIQKETFSKPYSELLTNFEPIAAQYKALKTKPTVSEEQRKYIVQANVLNQQKMYDKAIELYKKALEVNPTSYPAAYTNLALLSAQILDYQAAIFYMKEYLLLEPDASDARSSQDKIYEWEILMQN